MKLIYLAHFVLPVSEILKSSTSISCLSWMGRPTSLKNILDLIVLVNTRVVDVQWLTPEVDTLTNFYHL